MHPCGTAEVDARSWQAHTPDEDWLIWRARRTAERMRQMPIDISDGELIVGRPLVADSWKEQVDASVQEVLDTIPPFPGGDAGHFHPDYEKVFREGLGGILNETTERRASAETSEKKVFYDACEIAIKGASDYVRRVGDTCRERSNAELTAICERIESDPPTTFHEAIELMFLVMVCLWFGEDHGLTTPGRMDQTLRPFYEADLAAGRITRESAFELICDLFIQCNMVLGPGGAISVMVGGRDAQGSDVTNDLTYLCLEARLATRLVYPTVGLAWHEDTPPELMDYACRMLATGVGDPAFFNDELIVDSLRDQRVSAADSYNYMNSTCVEIKVAGASNMWVTAPYFNCPEPVLDVMDAVASQQIPEPASFDDFNALVKQRMAAKIAREAVNLDNIWRRRAEMGCFPLASCFISDCLERGLDFDRGGARYNWVENSFVGLANLVDGLLAIRHLVYETNELTIPRFKEVLERDYQGHEDLRLRIIRDIPSYGTDDDEADALAVEWTDFLQQATESNTVGGHRYVAGFFCWIMHGEFGGRMGATPDGRNAGVALADGAGAAQGRETAGPTASILSTTKWSHRKALGGLVHNAKFSGNLLHTEAGLAAMKVVIETYLCRGGFEIQVNVVSSDTLRDAQSHPENYRDLLVRVAGYSDYFTHLSQKMQEEVIARNEH
jgi:trans-4-hydroxy-L-proline dehydratase